MDRAFDGKPDLAAADLPACHRCGRKLTRGWGFFLGDLGELFVNREHFDIYVCSRCGRVEFFVDGIGEEFRPH